MYCLTIHFHRIACSFIAQPKSNVLAHLIYHLFTIYNQFSLLSNVQRMNRMYFCMNDYVLISHANIKMILYEQNVTLRLSLIDRNNAKQNYQ